MQAPRITYTICEGSLEEKTEEDGAADTTAAGHPALQQRSDIRHSSRKSGPSFTEVGPSQPGHPAVTPDIRLAPKPRTSGCQPGHPALPACMYPGRCPCTRFAPHLPLHAPRLYILLHLHHFRVSNGLAHMRDRALLIHPGSTPRERPRPLYGEDPPWIQDP